MAIGRIIDLTFASGEARTLTMRVIDPRTRLGVDLTGKTLTFTVRDELNSGGYLFQLTTGVGITHDADQVANTGLFTMAVSTTNTTQILGDHPCDLFLDDQRISDIHSVCRITASARYGEGTPPATPATAAVTTFAVVMMNEDELTGVHVDVTSGNDANNGRTAASALKTFEALYEKFPLYAYPDAKIPVNLYDDGADGVAVYNEPIILLGGKHPLEARYQYLGPAMVPFTPSSGPASATLDAGTPATIVDVDGVGAGSGRRTRLHFTTAAPAWDADDFQGAFARIDGTMYEFPISKNGADWIEIDHEGPQADVSAGETVEIVEPGASLVSTAGTLKVGMIEGNGIGCPLLGPFFTEGDVFSFRRLAFDGFAWETSVGTGLGFDRCSNSAFMVMSNCQAMLSNVAAAQAWQFADARIDVSIEPYEASEPTNTDYIDLCRTGGSAGVNVIGSSGIVMSRYSCWDIGATSSGLLVSAGSARVNTVIQGIVGANVGITVESNAHVRIPATVADRDIRGTAGMARLRKTGTTTAEGTAAGEFEEVGGYAGNFTEKNAGTAANPIGDASAVTDQFVGP